MDDLYQKWLEDEEQEFKGWDFRYIAERRKSEQPPWEYLNIVREFAKDSTAMLDIGTGGGERLLEIDVFPEVTTATEGWHPNFLLAKERLEPKGVIVKEAEAGAELPFDNESFDLVINRHTDIDEKELYRVLKPGGTYITQQVGGEDLQDLLDYFGNKTIYSEWSLKLAESKLREVGMKLERGEEWYGNDAFFDVGAVVYHLKSIPWSVPGFSVKTHRKVLESLQADLEKHGNLTFTTHRFLIIAIKP